MMAHIHTGIHIYRECGRQTGKTTYIHTNTHTYNNKCIRA